jgi:hypothetical protein
MTQRKAGRKGGPSMTPDIIALNAKGMTGIAIADHLGCSGAHVSKVLYRHRNEAKHMHRMTEHWKAPPSPKHCREWVQTPDGLRPCGQPKHKIDGESMGQCLDHYEKQRPVGGKTIIKAA